MTSLQSVPQITILTTNYNSNKLHLQGLNGLQDVITGPPNATFLRLSRNDSTLVVSDKTGCGFWFAPLSNLHQGTSVNVGAGVLSLHITPDGHVLCGDLSGGLHLFAPDANGFRKCWSNKSTHTDRVLDVKMFDGFIFTASADKQCGQFAFADGHLIKVFSHASSTEMLRCIALLAPGPKIFMASQDGKISCLDVTRDINSAFSHPSTRAIVTLKLSEDSKVLVSAGDDGTVRAHQIDDARMIWATKCGDHVGAVVVQDSFVIVSIRKAKPCILDIITGVMICEFPLPSLDYSFGLLVISVDASSRPLASLPQSASKTSQQADSALLQALTESQAKIVSLEQSLAACQHNVSLLQQQLHLANQTIATYKQNEDNQRLTSWLSQIENLSGEDMKLFGRYLGLDLSVVDVNAISSRKMIESETFSSFFESSEADVESHDILLHIYSVVKIVRETGQLPPRRPVAEWIIANKQQPEIAARFASLKITEEMMLYLDPTLFALRLGMKPAALRVLQADFIASRRATETYLLPLESASTSASASASL